MRLKARFFAEDHKLVCPLSTDLVDLDSCRACPRLIRIEEPPGGPVVYCSPMGKEWTCAARTTSKPDLPMT